MHSEDKTHTLMAATNLDFVICIYFRKEFNFENQIESLLITFKLNYFMYVYAGN